jgi:acetyl-CoA C-acetyltransferase
MESVVILSAQRSPIGSFMGSLSSLSAPRLGSLAIAKALQASQVDPALVDECVMGQVLSAGSGQAPARQAAILAGLPKKVPCMTINKVCGSGLKAVLLASDSLQLGHSQVVVAGGQESMSQAPHLLENSRQGFRMGAVQMQDSMLKDGLWDPYKNWHMGQAAELCVREHQFSREQQDEFARQSYEWAQSAAQKGLFQKEMFPVEIQTKSGVSLVEADEEPGKAQFAKMSTLKPAFDKAGSITAANASKINDGAAALVLASGSWAQQKGLKPLARIVASAQHAQEPDWFTTAPVPAMQKALAKAGLKVSDIDLWEINEAFAVVTMAAMKEMGISRDRVNVHGGAIALGHPIGASGARILTTLVHALHERGARRGLASLCIGGGEAVAVIVERA